MTRAHIDRRYGLLISVHPAVYTLWVAARGIPVVMVAALWAMTAWKYLT